jgi:hypothetical protein
MGRTPPEGFSNATSVASSSSHIWLSRFCAAAVFQDSAPALLGWAGDLARATRRSPAAACRVLADGAPVAGSAQRAGAVMHRPHEERAAWARTLGVGSCANGHERRDERAPRDLLDRFPSRAKDLLARRGNNCDTHQGHKRAESLTRSRFVSAQRQCAPSA